MQGSIEADSLDVKTGSNEKHRETMRYITLFTLSNVDLETKRNLRTYCHKPRTAKGPGTRTERFLQAAVTYKVASLGLSIVCSFKTKPNIKAGILSDTGS